MHAASAARQTFGKNSSPGFAGRMTLTGRGLVLGAGTSLTKLDGKAHPIEADQERIWTLLSVAYGEKISPTVSDRFAAWQNTGKAATNVSP